MSDSASTKYEGKLFSFTLDKLESEEKAAGTPSSTVRKIKGYANKNIIDRGNQRIEPAAFAAAMPKFMNNPMLFFNHDWTVPIGRVDDFAVTSEGLVVEATIGTGFAESDKVWSMIEQDLLRSFSVGLRPFNIEEEEDGSETITELELFEVSVVTIPMNADSTFEISSKGDIKSIMIQTEDDSVTYKDYISSQDSTLLVQESIEVEEKAATALSRTLNSRITTMVNDGGTREGIVKLMASAAKIDPDTVNQILTGDISCPPRMRLAGFARVLSVSTGSLIVAAEKGGCNYSSDKSCKDLDLSVEFEQEGICMLCDAEGLVLLIGTSAIGEDYYACTLCTKNRLTSTVVEESSQEAELVEVKAALDSLTTAYTELSEDKIKEADINIKLVASIRVLTTENENLHSLVKDIISSSITDACKKLD